ncbi:isoleucine--tRNA ligase [Cytophagales bacterium LB-30]|uniref:Isoleucine--tRNA ligase n=1 Tax=Shiella aurantiaca TaxID=3058365 RepID=A0ABT8F664_9BACT|nr:isoleucine--tRNA ligase [Shiella aurantiaca]MDN4165798.1 isoleucine--tRNA ligase [Shiella aurantiaca]
MSKKYKEFKNPNYAEIGEEILSFWKANGIFEASVNQREGQPTFTFYEGPPSANGTPGIHHVMARTVKDIFCRYKTLKGFQVKRKGGWDTHGLPVELQVEKELGITKEDIGKKITVEEYNQKCREAVMKFKQQWDDLTEQMGYWVDLKDPYITFENSYVETLWFLLKELFDKGLLYKGYTVQPYSPAAGTGLSSHELNQPGTYKMLKDTSIIAQFKVKHSERSAFLFEETSEPVYILAWTTTPWTLPSNCALAVGEKIRYVKVKSFNPYTFEPISVVLAKDLVGKYFSEKAAELPLSDYKAGDKLIPWKITQEFSGKDLLEIRYEQLMPYVTNADLENNAFRVIPGDFVTTEDGTGIVHTASVFGADDFRVAKEAGVPAVMVLDENGKETPLVDKQGRFVKEVSDFALRFVKEEYYSDAERNDPEFKPTDVLIAIKLKQENKAFKVEKYEHSYPHCWRTDKPVLYYPLDSWFIKTTAMKDRLVELNKSINWKPESTGTGRFGNWLENLVDWNLSRSRFWGTPLPIWVSEDGEQKCIGSLMQLKAEIEKSVKAGIMKGNEVDMNHLDLHRPYVDRIILVSDSGKPMNREPDLVDVWFDSGAMPYAQWGLDQEKLARGEKNPFNADFNGAFPADFIAEGVDQTRGWFFTLHALSVMLHDKVAFKNVIANGLVLDKNGNKMSKRLGNAIDPFKTIREFGPDATRWYMIENANPWDNLKFNLDGVQEVQRRFFGTLLNTYSFFALYANLDGFEMQENKTIAVKDRPELDRWILSKLQILIKEVDESFANYDATRAARAIQDFVTDQLSNWYVRLSRKRFWRGNMNADKQAAYETLFECLSVTAQLMSPIAPFFGEWLYKNLHDAQSGQSGASLSVHLTHMVSARSEWIDESLNESMDMAQRISSLIHSLRKKHMIKVRQPLSRVLIPVLNEKTVASIKAVEDIILAEVNVKAIEYIDDTSGVLVKKIKPNFKKLGAQYGPRLKEIGAAISQFGQEDIKRMEKDQGYALTIGTDTFALTLEDVEIMSEDIPGWLVANDGPLTVALDITITDALREEGVARDLVNRIQNLRKDMGLEVQDKIKVSVARGESLIEAALQSNREYICRETQALQLNLVDSLNDGNTIEMDDLQVVLKIEL